MQKQQASRSTERERERERERGRGSFLSFLYPVANPASSVANATQWVPRCRSASIPADLSGGGQPLSDDTRRFPELKIRTDEQGWSPQWVERGGEWWRRRPTRLELHRGGRRGNKGERERERRKREGVGERRRRTEGQPGRRRRRRRRKRASERASERAREGGRRRRRKAEALFCASATVDEANERLRGRYNNAFLSLSLSPSLSFLLFYPSSSLFWLLL